MYNSTTFPKTNIHKDTQKNKYHFEEKMRANKFIFACKKQPHNPYHTIGDVITMQRKLKDGTIQQKSFVVDEVIYQRSAVLEKGFPTSRCCYNLVLKPKN